MSLLVSGGVLYTTSTWSERVIGIKGRHSRALYPIRWLEAELAKVNRTVTPWLAVSGHRPIYVDTVDDGCALTRLAM